MLDTGNDAVSEAEASNPAVSLAVFLREPDRFDILSRRVPALGTAAAAQGERTALAAIERRLGELNAALGDFRAGLTLFELAETNAAFQRSWGPIACRDAALALTKFRAAVKAIGEALKACPTLRGARTRLRPVERRLAEEFPVTTRGASRAGAQDQAPAVHGAMCDAAIAADIFRAGRRVSHARDGRALHFTLSEASLWRLVALRDEAFAVFEER
jgi:hypothetical protein